jgi:hypothetical protein
MNKVIALASAIALGCAALAAFAADGRFYSVAVDSPTGGTNTVNLAAGNAIRLDVALDKAGTVTLVRSIAGQTLSSTNLVTAAGAATFSGIGVLGSSDFVRIVSATNAAAKIYVVTQ